MSSSDSSVKASNWHAASKRTSSSTSRKVVPSASRRRFKVRRCMASISATASPDATRFSSCTRSERRSFSIRSGWAMAFACASRLRRSAGSAPGTGRSSQLLGKRKVLSSELKRTGQRNRRRYGLASAGAAWASSTSLGTQPGPHSSRMMLTCAASTPS